MGKTAFVMRMIRDVCMKDGKTCLYFSLAETGLQLMKRLIVLDSLDDSILRDMRSMENEDFRRSIDTIKNSRLYINERAYTIKKIKKSCRELCCSENPDILIIDSFQLIKSAYHYCKENKHILDELRMLAKESDCPIIVISQLGRNIEKRPDHRPLIPDLMEVGLTDDFFDKIIFLYRDDYYDETTDRKGVADILVAKNKTGGIGTISLAFVRNLSLFENLLPN